MESEDIPDSTVNIGDNIKERILSHHSNLMECDDDDIHDERTSTNKGNNTLLISRVFKKSTTTTSSSTSNTTLTSSSSSIPTSFFEQRGVEDSFDISTSEPTIPKLSFIGKGLDCLNSNSGGNLISTNINNTSIIPTSTSPNKSAYGSTQSRPSGPVRNFLRPSGSSSKFSSGQTKIFSTHTSNIGSTTTGNVQSSTINIPTSTSSSGGVGDVKINVTKKPELVGSFSKSSSSLLSLNSSQMSSSFVTNSNQSTSLKLQIRRNPEPTVGNIGTSSSTTTKTTSVKQNILALDEYNSSDSNSSEPSPKYSDINESSSCSGGGNNTNSYVSSSAEDISLVTNPSSISSILKMKDKQQQQQQATNTNTSGSGGVIRQLNSDVRVQIQQHSNGKVVDINIDDNATQNPLSINNNNKNIITEADDEEMDEEDEVDDDDNDESDNDNNKEGSNSESVNLNKDLSIENLNTSSNKSNKINKSKNNTITITIGDQGVISEKTGETKLNKKKPNVVDEDDGGGGNEDDTRRTKRKRKPTRPFMPDLIVPRIKIRRKKGEEQLEQVEGTLNSNKNNSNIGFSFETIDDKNLVKNIENSTPSSTTTPSISTPTSTTMNKDLSSSDTPQEKIPRPRGRPKGSVNRVKKEIPETSPPPQPKPQQSQPTPPGTPRGRGRPRGSTNKNKIDREQTLIIKQKRKSKKSLLDTSNKEEEKDDNEVGSPTTETTPTTITTGEDKKLKVENQKEEQAEEEVSSPSLISSPVSSTSQVPTDRNSEIMSSPSSPPKQIRRRGAPRGPRMRGSGRGGGGERTPVTAPAPEVVVTEGDKIITGRRILKPRKPRPVKEKKEKKEKPKKEKPPKPILAPPPVQVFEEETRMSADIKPEIINSTSNSSSTPATPIPIFNSEPPTPIPLLNQSIVPLLQDEASNMSSTSTSATGTPKMKKYTKDLVLTDRIPITADTLFEYLWPPNDETGEMYMLQEQVSEFLGVKSFKRKYPDMNRRIVDIEERDFLRASKAVSETQCDLGLTALSSSDVLDIMFNDFPDKYEEFSKMLQERKERELVKNKISSAGVTPVRDRTAEFYRRCLKSAAKWNAGMNRQRREERACALDLQTLTLHFPKGRMKVLPPEATKVGHYPVPVLPGQYCDSYKTFTPDELKYLPLNTVIYGPIVPQESLPPLESDSDDESSSSSSSSSTSSSGSDSDSDSDEASTSYKEADTSTEIPTGPRFTGILPNGITTIDSGDKKLCKSCEGDYTKNKLGQPEALLHCTKCDVPNHPSCLELRSDMLPFIQKYNWQCTDCKNCIMCNDPADEDKMLFCDLCDRGYHIYCVGLRKVPIGRWHCQVCSVCHSCGVTQPSPTDRLAEWHHEFKKGEKNTKYFMHSLCISCHKVYKKGQFCPTCLKVHLKLDDKSLSECRGCEKWVHRECAKQPLGTIFGLMCEPCSTSHMARTKLPSHIN